MVNRKSRTLKFRKSQELTLPLILASSSPRRREILRRAGIRFRCVPSKVRERPPRPRESHTAYAMHLAREKAYSVMPLVPKDVVILAADTVVGIQSHILGKPRSRAEARRMLRLLSGRSHWVITGVVLMDRKTNHSVCWSERTRVTFSTLADDTIDTYISSREPFDKAGAYAVQGLASKFVTRIEGCFFNVMGLPIGGVYRELRKLARRRPSASRSLPLRRFPQK